MDCKGHLSIIASKTATDSRTRGSVQIFIVIGLCCFFYLLGAWQRSGFGKGDSIALEITRSETDCSIIPRLNFESHHAGAINETIGCECNIKK